MDAGITKCYSTLLTLHRVVAKLTSLAVPRQMRRGTFRPGPLPRLILLVVGHDEALWIRRASDGIPTSSRRWRTGMSSQMSRHARHSRRFPRFVFFPIGHDSRSDPASAPRGRGKGRGWTRRWRVRSGPLCPFGLRVIIRFVVLPARSALACALRWARVRRDHPRVRVLVLKRWGRVEPSLRLHRVRLIVPVGVDSTTDERGVGELSGILNRHG